MNLCDLSSEQRCSYCGKFPVIGPPGCCEASQMEYPIPFINDVNLKTQSEYSNYSESYNVVQIDYNCILHETKQSWLLRLSDQSKAWFPKKYIKSVNMNGGTMQCPEWLARKKGLLDSLARPDKYKLILNKIAEIRCRLDTLEELVKNVKS